MTRVHVGDDFTKNFGRLMWKTMVQWLQLNTEPDYIYESQQVVDCAIENHMELLAENIKDRYFPEFVFDETTLEIWALSHGFTR